MHIYRSLGKLYMHVITNNTDAQSDHILPSVYTTILKSMNAKNYISDKPMKHRPIILRGNILDLKTFYKLK